MLIMLISFSLRNFFIFNLVSQENRIIPKKGVRKPPGSHNPIYNKGKDKSSGIRQFLLEVPALALTSWMTLGQSFQCELSFLIYKMEKRLKSLKHENINLIK